MTLPPGSYATVLVEELFGAEGPHRLGEFARRATEELDTLEGMAQQVARELTLARDDHSLSLERDAFTALPFGLRLHVLRRLLDRLQPDTLDQRWNEAAFRRVLNFVEEGHTRRGSSTSKSTGVDSRGAEFPETGADFHSLCGLFARIGRDG